MVTKKEFRNLLAELWDKSFLPQHHKSGFRRTALSRNVIPSSQLTKALPFSKPPPIKKTHGWVFTWFESRTCREWLQRYMYEVWHEDMVNFVHAQAKVTSKEK